MHCHYCIRSFGDPYYFSTTPVLRWVRSSWHIMSLWQEDVVLGKDIKGPTNCAVFSAQAGKHLLTASQDRLVRLYNPSSGLLVQKYAGHGYEVLEVAPYVSPSVY